MPWWLAVLTLVVQVAIMVLAVYDSPWTMGAGLVCCALGVPVYGLLYLTQKHQYHPQALSRSLHHLLYVIRYCSSEQMV